MKREHLQADSLYFIVDVKQYIYTPDGVGAYWYDKDTEVIEAGFGDLPLNVIDTLED